MSLSERPTSEEQQQRPDQRQLSSSPSTRNILVRMPTPTKPLSSTSQLMIKFAIAPRKSRPFSYVTLEGELNTPDACKSNHRKSIFMGTTIKNKQQIVKTVVEHPALLPMEGCNWGMLKLFCRDRIPSDVILYYDNKPNLKMPGHLNYVALGINKFEGFKSYFDKPPAPEEFKKYAFKKGWIKSLVFRYLLAERDAHRRNFNAEGLIIDLDMLFGPITGEYKDSYADIARPYNEETHKLTVRDFRNFPDVEDFNVMFWVTKSEPFIPEKIGEYITKKIVELKNNAFRHEDNELFRAWKDDPEVHYLKFLYFMKFILVPDAAIRQAALDHYGYVMPETESADPSKPTLPVVSPFVERYTSWTINRREATRKILVEMPEFEAFITKSGQKALEELKEEFREDNALIRACGQKKMENYLKGKYKNPGLRRYDDQAMFNLIIDIDDVSTEYKRLCNDIKSRKLSSSRAMSRQHSMVDTGLAQRGRQDSVMSLRKK